MKQSECSTSLPRLKPTYSSNYSEEAWEVKVALPGVDKDDLNLSIENEILAIDALRKANQPESWRRLSGTIGERHYQLKLDVGPEVEDTKIEASLENGELLVRLPLKEQAKPRQIPIN